jgi:hypothetical protein
LHGALLPSCSLARVAGLAIKVVACVEKADERINGGKLKKMKQFNL